MITPLKTDLSIWNKLELGSPPVGVKFLFEEAPEGFAKLDTQYAVCELIKLAQQSDAPFYMTAENECCVGRNILGMEPWPPGAKSGQLGVKLGIFQDSRCNARLYHDLPMFKEDTVNSVVFAPLNQIKFDPDLLLVMAEPSKAEIILRAMAYSTGERYSSLFQTVISCAYMFVYPMLSGKVNMIPAGLGFGTKIYEAFEPGSILLCIPYQWIPVITHNLAEINWVLPAYEMDGISYRAYFPTLLEDE